jgi:hypothetical protein
MCELAFMPLQQDIDSRNAVNLTTDGVEMVAPWRVLAGTSALH